MAVQTKSFGVNELVKIKTPPNGWVVLNSGGPLMQVIYEEDGNATVELTDPDGVIRRDVFPIACLSRLVPYKLGN